MKESGIKQWWALFWVFFKINLFTFGGGYTIVPVIRDEFVRRKGWIEEEEMLDQSYSMSGNKISVKSLDLGSDFDEIAMTLDGIAENLKVGSL